VGQQESIEVGLSLFILLMGNGSNWGEQKVFKKIDGDKKLQEEVEKAIPELFARR